MIRWSCSSRQKVMIRTTDFCHSFYKWIFHGGSRLDHTGCGIFSEYLLALMLASKYGAQRGTGSQSPQNQILKTGASFHSAAYWYRLTTAAQQNVRPVYRQNIAESAYMTSHVIMSDLLCILHTQLGRSEWSCALCRHTCMCSLKIPLAHLV